MLMGKFCTHLFLAIILLFHYLSSTFTEGHEFSYDHGRKDGPAHWGSIKPEWHKCKTGTNQSPIHINNHTVELTSRLGPLITNYRPSNASLFNTGHDIRLEWTGDAGFLLINGTKYSLLQCHWHSPAEHAINGKRFDLEAHMVHQSKAGRIAVTAVLYEIRRLPNTFLQTATDDLRRISKDKKAKVALGVVHPKRVISINRRRYYRYMGSLTTPPCEENVVWTIVGEAKPVSSKQVGLLRIAAHDASYSNTRPLQKLNSRSVQWQISKSHSQLP